MRVAPSGYREFVDGYRVQPGLMLPLLPEEDRVRVGEMILRAAEALIARYEQSADEYERGYPDRLRELVTSLGGEVARLRSVE